MTERMTWVPMAAPDMLQGWGLASLDQDAAELNLLARHLKASYGSQVWRHDMQRAPPAHQPPAPAGTWQPARRLS